MAREIFTKGDRVIISADTYPREDSPREAKGVVTGFDSSGNYVRVKVDGFKIIQTIPIGRLSFDRTGEPKVSDVWGKP